MPIAGLVVMFVLALPASPEDALKKFVTAFDKRDVNTIASLVVGGQAKGSYLDMWKSQKTLGKESLSLKVGKVKLNGTKATVQIDSSLKSGAVVSSDKETLQMSQQKDKSWKIVPSKTRPKKGPVGILAHYAVTMLPVQPNNLHMRPADQIRYRLFNMQELSRGMHQRLFQQKLSYPTTPYSLRMMLESYRPLVDPIDNHRYVISLNPSLAGKKYPYPDMKLDTVALFLGKPGNVWFDEHGYTYIGLVDGTAIKATRAEVPKLRWLL